MNLLVTEHAALMSSREIAELVEKDTSHIHRDIREMLAQLGDDPDLDHVKEEKDSRGYTYQYLLPRSLTLTLVSGYSVKLRKRIIDRLDQLEMERAGAHPVPAAMLPATQARVTLEEHMAVAALFEVPKHIAQVEAVKLTRSATGVDFSTYLLHAPAQSNIREDEVMLEPTELGERFGLSPKQMNVKLAELGLQVKFDKDWQPTARGNTLCAIHQWSRGAKSGYNLKWNYSKVSELMEEMEHLA